MNLRLRTPLSRGLPRIAIGDRHPVPVLPLLLLLPALAGLLLFLPACPKQPSRISEVPFESGLRVETVPGPKKEGVPSWTPRSVACGPEGQFAVLDASGAVHVFNRRADLESSFLLPGQRSGGPGGNPCFHPDGTLFVADTHRHRVLHLDPATGALLGEFGSLGTEEGQFTYPLAVALSPCPDTKNLEIFVSEYGAEDRIQVFTESGHCLRTFGTRGTNPGELDRATGMVFGPDEMLYVADSCNHRIQVFDRGGRLQKVLGPELRPSPPRREIASTGTSPSLPSAIRFPFGVAVQGLVDNPRTPAQILVWVCEYGTSRLTGVRGDGRAFFRASKDLDLLAPRGLATRTLSSRASNSSRHEGLDAPSLLIADTGNRRVLEVSGTAESDLVPHASDHRSEPLDP